VKPSEPLPLYHSWPLFDRERQLGVAGLFNGCESTLSRLVASAADGQALACKGIGLWECTLADSHLNWSAGVYDLFGLPRGSTVDREETVALYCEESRAAMERLRAYAIRHRRGFTINVEIRPSLTRRQWIRLSAAPLIEGGKVVRLHGVKQLLS